MKDLFSIKNKVAVITGLRAFWDAALPKVL